YVDAPRFYHKRPGDELDHEHPNLTRLDERIEQLIARVRQRGPAAAGVNDAELVLYEDLAVYLLYRRYRVQLHDTLTGMLRRPGRPPPLPFWKRFRPDSPHLPTVPGWPLPNRYDPARLFACFFQFRRAFHQIYHHVVGASGPVARLRGAV